ncbi:hypothetical protein PORCAN_2220 [Porphyromonas crevioricanis JCM 13913]|nr:hypothetical protein PORCAN_2220 [Porphyromonas crevioricanis JCM 13913]
MEYISNLLSYFSLIDFVRSLNREVGRSLLFCTFERSR